MKAKKYIILQNIDCYALLICVSKFSNTDSTIDTVKLLIDNGTDLNFKNMYGKTTLMVA